MTKLNNLSERVINAIRCPSCHSHFQQKESSLVCSNIACNKNFPIVNGIPVLINEENSLFTVEDFTSGESKITLIKPYPKIIQLLFRIRPQDSLNVLGKRNYERLRQILRSEKESPLVLIVGGGILGAGMEPIANDSEIELVETDVTFAPRTQIIVDAHDIPFADETFDCVVAQAVLEHVVDPNRCVAEFHRVLKKGGYVYAETPFMQQVHMRPYDFQRFTDTGHRILFRDFEEIDSGVVCGPGMALAWAYRFFFLSFGFKGLFKSMVSALAMLTNFWFKYFDYYLVKTQESRNAGSGYYFLGQKTGTSQSLKEIIKKYSF